MGIYASANANSARVVSVVVFMIGYAFAVEMGRVSGVVLAGAGAILFLGVGDEVSATSTHDILPTLAFFILVLIGIGMFGNGL